MFYIQRISKFFLYSLCLLFGWGILGCMQEDVSEFSRNILRVCRSHRRLKQEQQTLLITWIEEILESSSLMFDTRYNLKKCKKSLSKILKGKNSMRDSIVKFFFEGRIKDYQEECRQLTEAKDPLNIGKEELEELRKFTEETNGSPESEIRLNHFYSPKFDEADNNFLGNNFDLSENFNSVQQDDQTENHESDITPDDVKYILPYDSYSSYLSSDGTPILMETEDFVFKHDSLLLLVPNNLPMRMSYVKVPLPQLEPQPSEKQIEYSIFSLESQTGGIDELYREESEHSVRSADSIIENEIIDEKIDVFESSGSSSDEISESEFVDLESLNLSNVLGYGKNKGKKRLKSDSVSDDSDDDKRIDPIKFGDSSLYKYQNGLSNNKSLQSIINRGIGETDSESENAESEVEYSNYDSDESRSGSSKFYDDEDETDTSQGSEEYDSHTSESQAGTSEYTSGSRSGSETESY